jgi:hypothetical protein
LQPVAPVEVSQGQPLGEALLALNNAHAQQLSWLEPERLQRLVEQAFLARRIGDLIGCFPCGVEVGTASVYDGSRTVRYLSHALSAPDAGATSH